jgi:MEMO1 family protein
MMKRNLFALAVLGVLAVLVACAKPEAKESGSSLGPTKGDRKMIFQPVVAGQFYTGDPKQLKNEVAGYISDANVEKPKGEVLGLIAPHAGYVYSGPVAGYAFKTIQGNSYDNVVVIGLSHRVPGRVSVLAGYDAYKTPLGEIPMNRSASEKLVADYDWIDSNEALFSSEHSLEVELPFLQQAVPNLKVVMVSMRTESPERCRELAKALDKVFGGTKTLFVASSDMSHFHGYDQAKKMDLATLDLVDKLDTESLAEVLGTGKGELCGAGPVITLLELFKLRGGNAEGVNVLKYMNSGDTAGDKSRVVGYGAVALVLEKSAKNMTKEKPDTESDYISAEDKKTLLAIARQTVVSYVRDGKAPDFDIDSAALKQDGAAFVTLHKQGQLRGCIGQIIARMPLWKCVREMAVAAATQDPRFSKVRPDEIPQLHIEVSVLTPPMVCEDPQNVVVGKHGLIMSRGYSRGLLLPQVPTEWGWDRETFLTQTCRKAGMDGDCWKDPKTKIETFEAIVFSEKK